MLCVLEYMYECVYTTPEMSKLQPTGILKDPQTNKHFTWSLTSIKLYSSHKFQQKTTSMVTKNGRTEQNAKLQMSAEDLRYNGKMSIFSKNSTYSVFSL